MMVRLIFCLAFSTMAFFSNAETVTAIQSGSWFASETWSCKRMPARTDAIIIPQGVIVSVTQPLYLGPTENGKSLVIAVAGTLSIANASIYLDPIDRIMVMPGGKITTKTFGGMVFSGTYAQYLEGGTTTRGPVTFGDGHSTPMVYDITAENDAAGVTLEWRSGSEVEVNYYHIMRSVDGINYEQIGKVDGRGSKKQKLFSFVDAKHPAGTMHYRVDLVNMNGFGGAAVNIDVTADAAAVGSVVSGKGASHK